MAYLHFSYKDVEVELTPDIIRSIRKQLITQIKDMPFGELVETVEASGLSVKALIAVFKKVKDFGK